MTNSRSFMDQHRSESDKKNPRMGKVLVDGVKVFQIETMLNTDLFLLLFGLLFKVRGRELRRIGRCSSLCRSRWAKVRRRVLLQHLRLHQRTAPDDEHRARAEVEAVHGYDENVYKSNWSR